MLTEQLIGYAVTAVVTWGAAIIAKRFGIHVDLSRVKPLAVPVSPPTDPVVPAVPAQPITQPRPVRDLLLWLLSVQAGGTRPAAGELAELEMVRKLMGGGTVEPPPPVTDPAK